MINEQFSSLIDDHAFSLCTLSAMKWGGRVALHATTTVSSLNKRRDNVKIIKNPHTIDRVLNRLMMMMMINSKSEVKFSRLFNHRKQCRIWEIWRLSLFFCVLSGYFGQRYVWFYGRCCCLVSLHPISVTIELYDVNLDCKKKKKSQLSSRAGAKITRLSRGRGRPIIIECWAPSWLLWQDGYYYIFFLFSLKIN